jgi:hypothetical protein
MIQNRSMEKKIIMGNKKRSIGQQFGDIPLVDLPFCLSGKISVLPPVSFCMDGATHQLHTFTKETVRLKGAKESVTKDLEDFMGKNSDVKSTVTVTYTVCGYYVRGPECTYLSVHAIFESGVFLKKLKDLDVF